MNIIETKLPGVIIIEPKVFGDDRGFFLETYQENRYKTAGIPLSFVQDNLSRSVKNVLRGLHHQKNQTQGKLVYVITGAVLDVVVDIRPDSKTFKQWISVELSDHNHKQIYVPPGYAHGFCVLSDTADFIYKCTNFYDPSSEICIQWNDPDIGIDWSIKNPSLSKKDLAAKRLKDFSLDELPGLRIED